MKFASLTKWYFRIPGNFYAYGPVGPISSDKRKAREYIREIWDLPKYTRFELWKA